MENIPEEKMETTKAMETMETGDSSDPVRKLSKEELAELLKTRLNKLYSFQRDILELNFGIRDGHEYSYAEIAKILRMPEENVKATRDRALKELQKGDSPIGTQTSEGKLRGFL
jgi:RNA polymerase nonessential primary-like sigma factor